MKTKEETINELLSLLTLEEKVALVAGHNFMSTNSVPRLNIPVIRMNDGPHGLRVQLDMENAGVNNSAPATCFPTASCSANTFNPSLLEKMGNAIAEECHFYDTNILLGPGVNIKRNPLCGRNFEYFSEDPFLAGRLGAGEVKGLQDKGVGVSLKHFALNNLENYRLMGDSIADMRAIREIYLRHFEYIVKETKPETVMCAYNKINGTHCSENNWLLNDILRKEWGFAGLVMSDWGTTHDRIKGIKSGLDLEMPGDTEICRKWIYDAVKDGSLDIKELDICVKNVLELVYKHADDKHSDNVDWDKHHLLAKDIALEGAVLLKNNSALPLSKEDKFLVVGDLFEKMRYQGAGSSMINPHQLVTPKDAFDQAGVNYQYVKGYSANKIEAEQSLIDEAVSASKDYDQVVVFMGLTDLVESEGFDRETMALPENQLKLIDALTKLNKIIIVVLYGGSTIELPFFNDADSVLNMFLPGQNGGQATYDLLFGLANPSGRLAETWPMKYEDVLYGDKYSKTAQELYKESIYVGYRYYVSKGIKVRFPFGYGLSYTTFDYSDLKVKDSGDSLSVSLNVKNTGKLLGKETIQVYVSVPKENTHKPLRELKGFTKIELAPNETKSVPISIRKEDLRYWDLDENRFVLEDGDYAIEIGKSAEDIVLSEKVHLKGEKLENKRKELQECYNNLDISDIDDESFAKMWDLTIAPVPPSKPLTLESKMTDMNQTFMGRILYKAALSVVNKEFKKAKKLPDGTEKDNIIKGAMFIRKSLDNNSLITLTMSAPTRFPYSLACGFRDIANGHIFKGLHNIFKKIKAPKLPSKKV